MTPLSMFFWLLVAHVLCDFPLQGDFLARGKNHLNPLPEVPPWLCLLAHALIQGGGVALVTGSVTLGILETVWHASIDYQKCSRRYGLVADQLLHLLCRIAILAVFWLSNLRPAV